MNTSKAPAARRFAPLEAGGEAAGDCPFESRPGQHSDHASRLPSLVGGPPLCYGPPTPSRTLLAAAEGGRSEARATAV